MPDLKGHEATGEGGWLCPLCHKTNQAETRVATATYDEDMDASILAVEKMRSVQSTSPMLWQDPAGPALPEDASSWSHVLDLFRGIAAQGGEPKFGKDPKTDIGRVAPGQRGATWFASLADELSRMPHVVKRLFIGTERELLGMYTVQACVRGCEGWAWHLVLVDGRVPCDEAGTPVGCESSVGLAWPCILEKAFAKAWGGYAQLEEAGAMLGTPAAIALQMGLSLGELCSGKQVKGSLGARLGPSKQGAPCGWPALCATQQWFTRSREGTVGRSLCGQGTSAWLVRLHGCTLKSVMNGAKQWLSGHHAKRDLEMARRMLVFYNAIVGAMEDEGLDPEEKGPDVSNPERCAELIMKAANAFDSGHGPQELSKGEVITLKGTMWHDFARFLVNGHPCLFDDYDRDRGGALAMPELLLAVLDWIDELTAGKPPSRAIADNDQGPAAALVERRPQSAPGLRGAIPRLNYLDNQIPTLSTDSPFQRNPRSTTPWLSATSRRIGRFPRHAEAPHYAPHPRPAGAEFIPSNEPRPLLTPAGPNGVQTWRVQMSQPANAERPPIRPGSGTQHAQHDSFYELINEDETSSEWAHSLAGIGFQRWEERAFQGPPPYMGFTGPWSKEFRHGRPPPKHWGRDDAYADPHGTTPLLSTRYPSKKRWSKASKTVKRLAKRDGTNEGNPPQEVGRRHSEFLEVSAEESQRNKTPKVKGRSPKSKMVKSVLLCQMEKAAVNALRDSQRLY